MKVRGEKKTRRGPLFLSKARHSSHLTGMFESDWLKGENETKSTVVDCSCQILKPMGDEGGCLFFKDHHHKYGVCADRKSEYD